MSADAAFMRFLRLPTSPNGILFLKYFIGAGNCSFIDLQMFSISALPESSPTKTSQGIELACKQAEARASAKNVALCAGITMETLGNTTLILYASNYSFCVR